MTEEKMKEMLYEAYKLDYASRHGMTVEDVVKLYVAPMASHADENYIRLDEEGKPESGLDCVDVWSMYEDVINNGDANEPWSNFATFMVEEFTDVGYISGLIRRLPINIGAAVYDAYVDCIGIARKAG